ncbi:F-box associated ubiquitination effector family protein, partial [Striga hermonthica]
KFRRNMEEEFLPFNYVSVVYQKFQTLRQGTRSVDDYTKEFYKLLTRIDSRETTVQLISRYISGLRIAIQDTVNMFMPVTLSDAHQRDLLAEQQLSRRPSVGFSPAIRFSPSTSGPSKPATVPGTAARPTDGRVGPVPLGLSSDATAAPVGPRPGGGLRCFSCGEAGHRRSECPRSTGGRQLFVDGDGEHDDHFAYDGLSVFDTEQLENVEVHCGDVGTCLVLRRSCLSPHGDSDSFSQRHQLFESTCTTGDRVCRFIVASGSCENVLAEEAVSKLRLTTEPHPCPYTLAWINRGSGVTVNRRVLVSFSIGASYHDRIWCNVV